MKYKVGDKVKIKSKNWYLDNKDEDGYVFFGKATFVDDMAEYCGREAKIVCFNYGGAEYLIDIDNGEWSWTDEMFEDSTSHIEEKPTISEQMVKDIAEVIKKHNLGVYVSENDGKLIIEPLNEKEEDLPIDTPVMVSNDGISFSLRYYAGNKRYFPLGSKSIDRLFTIDSEYIIPWVKFNPNDIEGSLKYNIVK